MFAGLHCSGVEPRVGARSPLQYSAEGSASNYYNARLYSDADNLLGEPLYYTLEVQRDFAKFHSVHGKPLLGHSPC